MTETPVTLPTMDLDSITPQTLRDFTQGKIKETDPRSELLIAGAVASVRRHCGWHVSPAREESFILDGRGGRIQRLPTLHIANVLKVTDGGQELTYRTDYRWSEMGLLERMHGSWSPHFRDVEVTAVHGIDDVPDIVTMILSVIARTMASPMGATREQAGAMSVTWANTSPGVAGGMVLLKSELAMLSSFRL
ncbi:hypothetical protein ACSYDW_01325 [Paeniglutamicibacter sp. R2-26]|uniref:hypothetical protein n=1 Tax=Paeniglutamicibacter sp. R2-26 TaxID=3144417 RepID=UPI003EE64753